MRSFYRVRKICCSSKTYISNYMLLYVVRTMYDRLAVHQHVLQLAIRSSSALYLERIEATYRRWVDHGHEPRLQKQSTFPTHHLHHVQVSPRPFCRPCLCIGICTSTQVSYITRFSRIKELPPVVIGTANSSVPPTVNPCASWLILPVRIGKLLMGGRLDFPPSRNLSMCI